VGVTVPQVTVADQSKFPNVLIDCVGGVTMLEVAVADQSKFSKVLIDCVGGVYYAGGGCG